MSVKLWDPYSALIGATDAAGNSIFSGKVATGFSNAEEETVGMVKVTIKRYSRRETMHILLM